jgi:uncharacterized protein
MTDVQRIDERSRYELVADGDVIGFADYRDDGTNLVFPHTVIKPEHRGRGNGDVLVAGALDDVRQQGRKVVPTCWFVREFIELHPDYADLLAS